MNNETKGTILALLTAIVSGGSIIANKFFVVNIDATVFTSVRALIIGLAFLAIIYYKSNFKIEEVKKTFKTTNWTYMILIAIIGGGAAFLLFFSGLQMTTGGRAAFLHKTLPIYVALFAYWFLKEKIPIKQTYALIIMLLGTVLIFGSQISPSEFWTNPLLGDFLVLGATVLWAVENTVAKKAMVKGDTSWIVAFSRMFIGALILFGFAGIIGKAGLLLTLSSQQIINIFLSTGILFCFVLFWYKSISLINVSKASTILLLAPVVSMILGVFVLSEPVPIMQVFGSVLILIGAYFVVNVRSELSSGV